MKIGEVAAEGMFVVF